MSSFLPLSAAEVLVTLIMAYGVTGLAVGVAFVLFGIERVSPGSVGAHAFRPLLLPGLALLWPLVLWRWVASLTPPRDGGRG